jgi:tetratricopeptide (TPR) repeat protein
MMTQTQGNAAWYRVKVDEARENGDVKKLCLALTDLGVVSFKSRQYEQGLEALEEMTKLAAETGDRHFQAQCLAAKAAAFEDIGRYHNAYEAMDEVRQIAEAHDDLNMKCIALINQGQILINSGEPMLAEEILLQARQLTGELDDQSHLMKVLGTMGNLKIAMAALDDSISFFDMAIMLAEQLGDQQAQGGYLINKGAVLPWQRQHAQAVPVFQQVLKLADEMQNSQLMLTSLRYLTECYHHTNEPGKIPALAQRGIELGTNADERDTVFKFFQTLILAHYRLNQFDDAEQVNQQAIEYARSNGDLTREVDMLINLGEACVIADLHERAFDAYSRALDGASQLERIDDEAYLTGRIGVVLAEMGRIDEAVMYHQQAAELARQRSIPDLEGEQLSMLALAALDQQDVGQAREYCQQAIDIFAAAQLSEQAAQARQLLAEINGQ